MTDQPAYQDSYAQIPSALIFSDSDEGSRKAKDAVTAAGGRIAACLEIGDAIERLNKQAAIDAIMVELEHEPGEVSDRLLDHIAQLVDHDGASAVISAPLAIINAVDARIGKSGATLLCEPDRLDRISALMIAWQKEPPTLADASRDLDSIRLRRLADEVSRIARSLSSLSSTGSAPSAGLAGALQAQLSDVQLGFSAEAASISPSQLPKAEEVRKLIRARRMRESFFDSALFADPAWDMLLDLFAAHIEGDQVAVSSLCIAASVPPTTALRWIKAMTDHGLFVRHADPMDGRRIFIGLSAASTRSMADFLTAMRRFEGLAI